MFLTSWDEQNKNKKCKVNTIRWCYKDIWQGNMWAELILYLLVWFWGLWVIVLCSLIVSMLSPPVSDSFLIFLCGDKLQVLWDHSMCCSLCVPDVCFLNHVSEYGYSLKLQWLFSSLHHVSPHIPLKFHLIYHIIFIMGWATLVNWELIKRCHELGYKPFFLKYESIHVQHMGKTTTKRKEIRWLLVLDKSVCCGRVSMYTRYMMETYLESLNHYCGT